MRRNKNPFTTDVLDKRTLKETSNIVMAIREKGVVAQDNILEDITVLDNSGVDNSIRTLLESKVEILILEDDI